MTGIGGPSLTVLIPGSGTIKASGATARLDVMISGHGTALLDQLSARDVRASLSGNGSIMLTATRILTASVSGSGAILYSGNPTHLTTSVTGSGTISAR